MIAADTIVFVSFQPKLKSRIVMCIVRSTLFLPAFPTGLFPISPDETIPGIDDVWGDLDHDDDPRW